MLVGHRYLSHFLHPPASEKKFLESVVYIEGPHHTACLRWVVHHCRVEGWVTQWISGGMLNPAVSN